MGSSSVTKKNSVQKYNFGTDFFSPSPKQQQLPAKFRFFRQFVVVMVPKSLCLL